MKKEMVEKGDYPSSSRGRTVEINEEKRKEINNALSKRKLNVVSFAEMGMNAEEIKLGFLIVAQENISLDEINSLIATAITNKTLPEKKKSAKNEDSLKEEELIDRVLKLVVAREVVNSAETVKKPEGKNGLQKVVEAMGDIDKPLDIIKNLLRRGISLPDAMQIANLEHSSSEDPIIRFAQELAGEEIIGENLSDYYQLGLILNQSNTKLLSPVYIVILESLVTARKGIRHQNLEMLSKYQELRDKSFNEGSDGESPESIELGKLENLIGEMDNSHLEYKIDDKGMLFRHGPNGERLFTSVGLVDGRIVFDAPFSRERRRISREVIALDHEEVNKNPKRWGN